MATIADFVVNHQAVREISEWIFNHIKAPHLTARPPPILFVSGPGGVGKTLLLDVLSREFSESTEFVTRHAAGLDASGVRAVVDHMHGKTPRGPRAKFVEIDGAEALGTPDILATALDDPAAIHPVAITCSDTARAAVLALATHPRAVHVRMKAAPTRTVYSGRSGAAALLAEIRGESGVPTPRAPEVKVAKKDLKWVRDPSFVPEEDDLAKIKAKEAREKRLAEKSSGVAKPVKKKLASTLPPPETAKYYCDGPPRPRQRTLAEMFGKKDK